MIFTKLKWMNLLSTGNDFTEIDLNKSSTTLIIGNNGAGKSTLLDALSFVLFGRAFRNINKPQLVNSITKKNMLVEVEFSIQHRFYTIRRGIKPNIFEVIVDGVLIDQDSKSGDYQTHLEKNILKMNYKSFKQIVVLGSSNYVPFMQLTAKDRREVIEDLLDIQVFTKMNNLLSEKVKKNRELLVRVNYEIDMVNQKIAMHNKHVDSIKVNNDLVLAQKQAMITDLERQIEELNEDQRDLQAKVDDLSGGISDQEAVMNRISKINQLESQLEVRVNKVKKDIDFFTHQNICPTCHQDIDLAFKEQVLSKREAQKLEFESGLVRLSGELNIASAKLSQYDDINKSIANLSRSIDSNNTQLYSWNQFIEGINREIELLNNDSNHLQVHVDELDEYLCDLAKSNSDQEKALNDKQLLDVSSVLLKDGGIKTKIVKQFVPIMNKLINKYLAQMDFFVDFTLDEQFNETIRSRFRDDFSYESFSEGEKMRLDLAVLFAWRSIAKLRNSMTTNLLILDEVFDSSLDAGGTEEFLKMIKDITGDTNLFIISHKTDALYDKFHSVIRFEKHKSFSKIAST